MRNFNDDETRMLIEFEEWLYDIAVIGETEFEYEEVKQNYIQNYLNDEYAEITLTENELNLILDFEIVKFKEAYNDEI